MRRRSLLSLFDAVVVLACVAFVFAHLQPALIFTNNTPTGGDMGSHVWAPAFMRDQLLPNWRITGWAPDWYAGFPAYTFYFPLPGLLIVLLDLVMPYGIAFKLVTILGPISLPVAAYLFGRLSGLRHPGPPILAAASLPFLFDTAFTIYGGNIPSVLAGEFSFAISLSLALVFLGVLANGLETGRYRALAPLLLAASALSHLIPALFATIASIVLLLFKLDSHRVRFFLKTGTIAFALAGFWALPLLFRLPYTNNMGYEKITEYAKSLFPPHMTWVFPLAVVGTISAVGLRLRPAMALASMTVALGFAFVLVPDGRLWNARLLPFWFLCLYLLAGIAVSEVGRAFGGVFSRNPERPAAWPSVVTPLLALAAVFVLVGGPLQRLPSFLPIRPGQMSYVPDWARWDYSGYESKEAYPEYRAVMRTMARLPCGRAMWEYDETLGRYGTPMAMMLLPYWTDGCIGSMEGLYFEASATTPYHFINASELSNKPSNPQRKLPYGALDVAKGVKHLQLWGVRYYMAYSVEALAQAEANPDLSLVAESGPWRIFEVARAPLVEALSNEPVVVSGSGHGEKAWFPLSLPFYTDPDRWDVFLAADGPEEWRRVSTPNRPPKQSVRHARVGKIRDDGTSLSFEVDRPGTPVLVKVSYFPNWRVEGARGPWRVTPNHMVVVPTSKKVEMHYGYTPVDVTGWILTLLGLVAFVRVARKPTEYPPQRLHVQDEPPAELHINPSADRVAVPVLSVIMPAFNEQQILRPSVTEVVQGLKARGVSFEIIVVENGSTDGTIEIARGLGVEFPEVKVATLAMGDYGRALRAGLLAASGNLVVNFDSDYFDLGFIDRARHLLEPPQSHDIVVGSKRTPGALDTRSIIRRLVTAVFLVVLRRGFGLRVSDTHGMKAMNRAAVVPIARECKFGADLFDTELIVRAERHGLDVVDIPVVVEERRPSRSNILRRIPRSMLGLLRLRLALWGESFKSRSAERRADSRIGWLAIVGVGALTTCYVAIFGYRSLLNHYGFATFGFDLGIFDQGVWLLSRLKDPFVTIMGVDLFGDHTSFILLAFLPLYWIYPTPAILLAAQTLALGVSAVPAFLIAREKLRSDLLGLVAAATLLMHPAVGWTNWENFHPDSFEVPILLFAILFMLRKRWFGFLVCIVLALLVKEDVPLLTFALGAYVAIWHDKKIGLLTMLLSAAWFATALFVVLPLFNEVGTLDAWKLPISQYGGVGGFIKAFFTRPGELFSIATGPDKPLYLLKLFGPFAFLSILRPALLLVAAGPLLVNLLSSFWYQFHIEYHYQTLIIPILFASSVLAISRFKSSVSRGTLVLLLAMCSLTGALLWGPLGVKPGFKADPSSPQAQAAREALALIPEDAGVSAFYAYVPHLAHREHIYEFPVPWRAVNWGDYSKDGQRLPEVKEIDYLALNEVILENPENRRLYEELRDDEFEEIFSKQGVIVLRRR